MFKKPDKMRMEIVTNIGPVKMKEFHISNGKIIWVYQPLMNVVNKTDLEQMAAALGKKPEDCQSGNIARPLNGFDPGSISYLGIKKSDEIDTYMFEGSASSQGMQKTSLIQGKMLVWIGVKDGLLRKLVVIDWTGKETMSQVYKNVKLNIDIDDSLFEFIPPEGVKITDVTRSTIDMMKAMEK